MLVAVLATLLPMGVTAASRRHDAATPTCVDDHLRPTPCATLVLGRPTGLTILSYRGESAPLGRKRPSGLPTRTLHVRDRSTIETVAQLLNDLNARDYGPKVFTGKDIRQVDALVFRYPNGDVWTVYFSFWLPAGEAWTHGATGYWWGSAPGPNGERAVLYLLHLLP
jgi:hypothetical protein